MPQPSTYPRGQSSQIGPHVLLHTHSPLSFSSSADLLAFCRASANSLKITNISNYDPTASSLTLYQYPLSRLCLHHVLPLVHLSLFQKAGTIEHIISLINSISCESRAGRLQLRQCLTHFIRLTSASGSREAADHIIVVSSGDVEVLQCHRDKQCNEF